MVIRIYFTRCRTKPPKSCIVKSHCAFENKTVERMGRSGEFSIPLLSLQSPPLSAVCFTTSLFTPSLCSLVVYNLYHNYIYCLIYIYINSLLRWFLFLRNLTDINLVLIIVGYRRGDDDSILKWIGTEWFCVTWPLLSDIGMRSMFAQGWYEYKIYSLMNIVRIWIQECAMCFSGYVQLTYVNSCKRYYSPL